MKRILKYIFSLAIILSGTLRAQDSLQPMRVSSAGLYLDLNNITYHLMEPEINSYSLTGDIKFNRNLIVSFEGGKQSYERSKANYDFELNGWYGKIGVGKNIIKSPDSDKTSNAFIMLRYCYSSYNQNAGNITFINTYWGEEGIELPQKRNSKHWIEGGGGLSAELLANFYIGWSFYLRISPFKSEQDIITPEHIPGYGNGLNNINAGFHYYISYRINFDSNTKPSD